MWHFIGQCTLSWHLMARFCSVVCEAASSPSTVRRDGPSVISVSGYDSSRLLTATLCHLFSTRTSSPDSSQSPPPVSVSGPSRLPPVSCPWSRLHVSCPSPSRLRLRPVSYPVSISRIVSNIVSPSRHWVHHVTDRSGVVACHVPPALAASTAPPLTLKPRGPANQALSAHLLPGATAGLVTSGRRQRVSTLVTGDG